MGVFGQALVTRSDGCSEVHVKARVLGQPLQYLGVLVRGVVVQHHMDLQLRRDSGIDLPEKLHTDVYAIDAGLRNRGNLCASAQIAIQRRVTVWLRPLITVLIPGT